MLFGEPNKYFITSSHEHFRGNLRFCSGCKTKANLLLNPTNSFVKESCIVFRNQVKKIHITSFIDQDFDNFSRICFGNHVKEIFITSFLGQNSDNLLKVLFGEPRKEISYYFIPRPKFFYEISSGGAWTVQ